MDCGRLYNSYQIYSWMSERTRFPSNVPVKSLLLKPTTGLQRLGGIIGDL